MIHTLAKASPHASFFVTMPNPPLTIRLKKTPDAPPVLTGVRADGTATWQHSHVAFPVHDLVHYSVESTLGIGNAFFGLVAQGWSFEDFGNGWPRGPIPWEALEVESIVGEVWRTFLLREELTAAELNERTRVYAESKNIPRPRAVTEQQLAAIHARLGELAAKWRALPAGGTLELEFPGGA
jgi:hypothetical protein